MVSLVMRRQEDLLTQGPFPMPYQIAKTNQ